MSVATAEASEGADSDLRLQLDLFRSAWRNANEHIGELHKATLGLRLALDASDADRAKLTAAVGLWRGRYKRSWRAILIMTIYASTITVLFVWRLLA